jgi:hypothetical protein
VAEALTLIDGNNPQRWNRYAYVDNNPLSFIDPDGRSKQDLVYRLLKEILSKDGKIAGFIETRFLSKEGALAARAAEKNIVTKAHDLKTAEKGAQEIETAVYGSSGTVHHPAGFHENATGHFQQKSDKIWGHTFYKSLTAIVVGRFHAVAG